MAIGPMTVGAATLAPVAVGGGNRGAPARTRRERLGGSRDDEGGDQRRRNDQRHSMEPAA